MSVESRGRVPALVGLAGAVLAGVGDVLILGRGVSGRDFDEATGAVPAGIEPAQRWRSMWNGAVLPRRRVQAGTAVGVVGIGLLVVGLGGVSRTAEPRARRLVAAGSSAAFAVSGTITHLACGAVILAYQRASSGLSVDTTGPRQPAPTSATRVLAVGAVGSLGALAVLSADLAVVALLDRSSWPALCSVVTPFPFVLATLLTFGRLPAPVGGYARPASISTGLALYFLLAAITASRRGSR